MKENGVYPNEKYNIMKEIANSETIKNVNVGKMFNWQKMPYIYPLYEYAGGLHFQVIWRPLADTRLHCVQNSLRVIG